jgi:hypothetical protein
MERWNPDPAFLEFLLQDWKQDGRDLDGVLISDGTRTYSRNELLQAMRDGTEFGRDRYACYLRADQERFLRYKARQAGS